MKLSKLIERLQWFQLKLPPDAEVDLMIEVNEPEECQYQFPANDIASDGEKVIIMHEKWGVKD